eukprot:scaffold111992_cov63-Phaeocystis_antarctica.AAC.5
MEKVTLGAAFDTPAWLTSRTLIFSSDLILAISVGPSTFSSTVAPPAPPPSEPPAADGSTNWTTSPGSAPGGMVTSTRMPAGVRARTTSPGLRPAVTANLKTSCSSDISISAGGMSPAGSGEAIIMREVAAGLAARVRRLAS